jgi:murein tripeptide amidase MpaA
MTRVVPVPPLPFDHFWTYSELDAFCRALANSAPDLVQLSTLAASQEGRGIQLLTITDSSTGPAEVKPAYLVHGNIHAVELSGTHAAFYTARQLVVDPDARELLRRVAFHIIPRINPDGAEFAVKTSGSIRSRIDRSQLEANTLYQEDLDGNGLILSMRIQHPDGDRVADPDDPRLLIRRRHDHVGPFYKLLPEGSVHAWDGGDDIRVEGRQMDWNRNWSFDWKPEPEQRGSGDFAFSELEMRALAEFIHGHVNLFGILGYHTGPAAVLTPPSTGSIAEMDEGDWHLIQELARIAADETGLPVKPVVQYRGDHDRDINLHGHFHSTGYSHLGLFVYEFELGILQNSAGISTEEMFAARTQDEWDAQTRKMMAWWDAQPEDERDAIFHRWTPFDHPQLGPVEIGGLLRRHWAGRTLPDLERIAKGTYRFTLAHAGRHPWVRGEEPTADEVAPGLWRIRLRVANRGAFPTHVTKRGAGLSRLRPVRVEFHPAEGVELLSAEGHRDVGHLQGITGSRVLEWFVLAETGSGSLARVLIHGGTGGESEVEVRVVA